MVPFVNSVNVELILIFINSWVPKLFFLAILATSWFSEALDFALLL
jgi:hypothetical protein